MPTSISRRSVISIIAKMPIEASSPVTTADWVSWLISRSVSGRPTSDETPNTASNSVGQATTMMPRMLNS